MCVCVCVVLIHVKVLDLVLNNTKEAACIFFICWNSIVKELKERESRKEKEDNKPVSINQQFKYL